MNPFRVILPARCLTGGRAGRSPDSRKAAAEQRSRRGGGPRSMGMLERPAAIRTRRHGPKAWSEGRARVTRDSTCVVRTRSPPPRPPNILRHRSGRGDSGVEATTGPDRPRASFRQHPAKDGAFPMPRMPVNRSSGWRGRRSLSRGSLLFGLRLTTNPDLGGTPPPQRNCHPRDPRVSHAPAPPHMDVVSRRGASGGRDSAEFSGDHVTERSKKRSLRTAARGPMCRELHDPLIQQSTPPCNPKSDLQRQNFHPQVIHNVVHKFTDRPRWWPKTREIAARM